MPFLFLFILVGLCKYFKHSSKLEIKNASSFSFNLLSFNSNNIKAIRPPSSTEGNFIKISAQAEKEAAQLKGEGIALFRQEVAKGMAGAAKEMEEAKLDSSLILFSMWTEAVKNFAQEGKGNVIFLDGSVEGMDKTMKQMMALNQMDINPKK